MTNQSNKLLPLTLCLWAALSGCNGPGSNSTSGSGVTPTAPAAFNASGVRDQVEQMVNEAIRTNPSLINAAVLISIPGEDFIYQQGFGVADPETQEAMTAEHPYRLASISKTFTAAVVLRMIEEGHFQLDDNLGLLFQDDDIPGPYTVNDLLVLDGTARGSEITIRQLLSHRSGLKDYIFDNKASSDSSYFEDVVADILTNNGEGVAQRLWTPNEMLQFYIDNWGTEPYEAPGGGFHYADTNFLILGLLVQKYAGVSLGQAYRNYVFDPLSIAEGYISWHEDPPVRSPAHHYFNSDAYNLGAGNVDVTDFRGMSVDWAGGGLAMNLESQRKFLRALVDGTFYTHQETFSEMRSWEQVDENDDQAGTYGLGFHRVTLGNHDTWGHDGFWGTNMLYLPGKDAIIVTTLNQEAADTDLFVSNVLKILDEASW